MHVVAQETARVPPLKVLSQRSGELLCVLSKDTVEKVDVEAVTDPPTTCNGTANDTSTGINNVGDGLNHGLHLSEEEEVDVTP